MAGEDYIIKVIRDINELEVLEKELEGFHQRELVSFQNLNKMKTQEVDKFLAHYNKSIKEQVQANKELSKQTGSSQKTGTNLTGQSTQLGSIDALKQQITHYTELRDGVSTVSAEFTNYDTKVRTLTQAKKDLLTQTKSNSTGFLEFGKNLVDLKDQLTSAFSGLYNFGKEAVTSAAKVQVLKENLKLTEDEFHLLKTAAAGSLTEQELLPLVAYGKQVGLTTNEIAQFISKSEQMQDEGIGDTASNFKTLTQAILTNGAGLETLGISQNQYNESLEKTAKSLGLTVEKTKGLNGETEISIKGLDAEKQALVNKMTLINGGYVHSLEEAKNKQVDVADKLDLVKQKLEEAKVEAGSFMLNALEPLIDGFLGLNESQIITISLLGKVGEAAINIIPFLGSLKSSFKDLSLASVGYIGLIISAVLAASSAIDEFYLKKMDAKNPNPTFWDELFTWGTVGTIPQIMRWIRKGNEDNRTKTTPHGDYWGEIFGSKPVDQPSREDFEFWNKFYKDINKNGSNGSKSETNFLSEFIDYINLEIRLIQLKKDFNQISLSGLRDNLSSIKEQLKAGEDLIKNDEDRILLLETELSLKNQIEEINNNRFEKDINFYKRNNTGTIGNKNFLESILEKALFDLIGVTSHASTLNRFNIEHAESGINTRIGGRRDFSPAVQEGENEKRKKAEELGLGGIIMGIGNEVSSLFQNMMSTLNIQAHTFVGQLVSGFNTVLQTVSLILQAIQTIETIKSFLRLIPFLAEGGEVSTGQPYFVGERGMELFVPNSNGYVYSNKELMKMVSNGQNRGIGNVVNNIYLNAGLNSELIVTKGFKAMNQSNRYKKVA